MNEQVDSQNLADIYGVANTKLMGQSVSQHEQCHIYAVHTGDTALQVAQYGGLRRYAT